MIFDTSLYCFGGRLCKNSQYDIIVENNLVDIWRIRNVAKTIYMEK